MEMSRFLDSLPAAYPPEEALRLSPSSFEPEDPRLAAVRRPPDWQWSSCARFLRAFGARTVILQLPLFWQLYAPLHYVAREAGCSIYPNEPGNIPIGVAAVRSGDANVVILEAHEAAAFAHALVEAMLPMPGWILVRRAHEAWELPGALRNARVAQEVHLFPGVPILEQCETLAASRSGAFHLADDFAWRLDPPAVTSAAFAFDSLELPFRLADAGTCACGKTAYRRL